MSQAATKPLPMARAFAAGGLGQLVAVGIALVVLTAAGPSLHMRFGGIAHWVVVTLTAAGAAHAALSSDQLDARRALLVIALVAVAMHGVQFVMTPYLSDDIFRYVWDGRVQGAGINPYRYLPAAPELAGFRDNQIYPFINRADYAPTIYPPMAQLYFWGVTRFGESVPVMKLGLLGFEFLALLATSILLARLHLPPSRIAAFAWHPLAVWEIAGSGHIDAGMVGLMMAGLGVAIGGRTLLAGVLITAAALMKPIALVVLPAIWRPWNWRLFLAVGATAAVLYIPYLSVGTKVFGFLGGYLQEEELGHGTGFRYLLILERIAGPVPNAALAYVAFAGLLMVALALAAGFRRDQSASASVGWAGVLSTAFLVLLTPHYPWYYLALVPFLAIYPRSWTLWLLTVGGMQTYQAVPGEWLPDYGTRQIVFHTAVLGAIARDAVALNFSHAAFSAWRGATGDTTP